VGYGCPPDGKTQQLLNLLGRHGQRPAHIHFFVEAPGHRKLTTQLNIAGDKYVHDDFAFATRDELIVEAKRIIDPAEIKARGLTEPFSFIRFDFSLNREGANLPDAIVEREHAKAA
jgi:catechol 1,2-dioxygenase